MFLVNLRDCLFKFLNSFYFFSSLLLICEDDNLHAAFSLNTLYNLT